MPEDGLSRLRVEIYGTEYTLRGRASVEHLHWVANKVDTVMRQIAAGNSSMDPKRVAVLTAINIADELHNLQAETQLRKRENSDSRRQDDKEALPGRTNEEGQS